MRHASTASAGLPFPRPLGELALVRVEGQLVMAVGGDTVMLFPRLLNRVHMYHNPPQVTDVVQQPVVDLAGYSMPFCHR